MVSRKKKQVEGQDICRRLGMAIRKRRLEIDISQLTLSEKSQVHRTYVSEIERGCRNITMTVLLKLAVALNSNISNLMRLSESLSLDEQGD